MFDFFLAFALFLLGRAVYKNFINPICVFTGVWTGILLVYKITIEGLSPVTDRAYVIIGLGLLAFSIGALPLHKHRKYILETAEKTIKQTGNSHCGSIKYDIVFAICVLTVLSLLPIASASIKYLVSGFTFQDLRGIHSSGKLTITNRFILLFINYIANPFSIIIIPICAADFIMGKRKRWLLAFTIAITLLQTLITAGRIQIVYIPLHFIVITMLAGENAEIPKAVKKFVAGLIIIGVVVLQILTLSRGSSWKPTTIGLYVSGGIPLMDHYLTAYEGIRTYGAASASGLLVTVFTLLENLGFPYPAFLQTVQSYLDVEKVVRISGLEMNAYVTAFYYLFIDGGYIGVAIGMFLYGLISRFSYFRSKNKSMRYTVIYALIVQGLVFSMIRLHFVNVKYCLAFLLIPFLISNDENYIPINLRFSRNQNKTDDQIAL